MSAPLVSVSGVRGIVGESFTEDLVRRWARAFARFVIASEAPEPERSSVQGGAKQSRGKSDEIASSLLAPRNDRKIVVGRDTRPSGAWALDVAARTVAECGVQPITVGTVPTPTVQLAVTHHRAAGGLIITASHNPTEWNGLKFLGPDGVFLSAGEMESLHRSVFASPASGGAKQSHDDQGVASSPPAPRKDTRVSDGQAINRHIANVLGLPLGVEAIRHRKFRVVLDPVNGAGALAVPPLLERLGCQVTVINGEPDGKFAHPPEPTPANLTELGDRVRADGADLGIAVDPDADRLVLVSEEGRVLSEEYTITLATLAVLSAPVVLSGVKNRTHRDPSSTTQDDKQVVAVNLSTTRMVDDVARQLDATVIRTPVGERHVVEGMRRHGALIGGEGNGGVIFPESHEGRDALVGIALILDLLAKRGESLATVVSALPRYVMVKEKLALSDRNQLPKLTEELRKLADSVPGSSISTLDGVRVDTPDGWVHLRLSNTEPMIRLIAEATDEPAVHRLLGTTRTAVKTTGH